MVRKHRLATINLINFFSSIFVANVAAWPKARITKKGNVTFFRTNNFSLNYLTKFVAKFTTFFVKFTNYLLFRLLFSLYILFLLLFFLYLLFLLLFLFLILFLFLFPFLFLFIFCFSFFFCFSFSFVPHSCCVVRFDSARSNCLVATSNDSISHLNNHTVTR